MHTTLTRAELELVKRPELVKLAAPHFPQVKQWLSYKNSEIIDLLLDEATPKQDELKMTSTNTPANSVADAIQAAITAAIAHSTPKAPELDVDAVEAICERIIGKQAPRVLEIRQGNKIHTITGHRHAMLEELILAASVRDVNGKLIPVMLVGPAGSGKTSAAAQTAKAHGLEFRALSVNAQTSKADLMGYMDGGGTYRPSAIRTMFEHGGIMLLDEIDAGNPAVLTAIHAVTDNGVCGFPDGVIERHKDFLLIAAANTYGRGSDRVYVGRQQMDGATLNRFSNFFWAYDETLERTLANNNKWVDFVQTWRKNCEAAKLRFIISPRQSIQGAAYLAAGFSQERVEQLIVFKGIDAESERKIRGC